MKITKNNADEMTTFSVNDDEARAISNALNESLELIEDWEYETRMGVSKEEVIRLLDEFREFRK